MSRGALTNPTNRRPEVLPIPFPFAKSAQADPDYDYKAAKAAGVKQDERGHWPDTYKLPSHITFSDESKYHDDEHQGGHWEQIEGNHWTFTPGPENLKHHSVQEMQDYFKEYEPDSELILPKDK